jgi:hypothetical protein
VKIVRALCAAAALLCARPGLAAGPAYAIVIGNNQPSDAEAELPLLRYADDDAGAVASFLRELGVETTLLTVFDADSQRRFPELAAGARPPTRQELDRAVARLAERLRADGQAGRDATVYLYFSGHGTAGGDGRAPALALLDGPLDQALLYDHVLGALPARYLHLIVDACHAEAVVRPRDGQAPVVQLTDGERARQAELQTLARFPHVGALIATTSGAQSHEWDLYRRGVFTHELLSALRGAGDVNGDGVIEYSEASAFLSAANREVLDSHARLSVVTRPPAVNRRAPLVDLVHTFAAGHLRATGIEEGRLEVEDQRGERLADVHPEPGFRFDLLVPAGQAIFVRSARGEARVQLRPGEARALDQLRFGPADSVARGALGASLARGLFATAFGPLYYRGFVDGRDELVAVPLAVQREATATTPARGRTPALALAAGAGVLAAGAATFAALSLADRAAYQGTQRERPAAEARQRFYRDRALAIGLGAGAAAAAALSALLWPRAGDGHPVLSLDAGTGRLAAGVITTF